VFQDYARAAGLVDRARNACSAQAIDAEGNGRSLFNPLPWRRAAAVTLADDELANGCCLLRDRAGRLIPVQPTGEQEGGEVVFVAPDLPAVGFSWLEPASGPPEPAADLRHGDDWAENRFFRVEFDPRRGVIRSLKLRDGRELCGDAIGRLDMLDDTPQGYYQTWNMDLTGREDRPACDGFGVAETGPVRVRFRARLSFGRWEKKKDFMVPIMWNTPGVDYPTSFFVHDFCVYADLPWIECRLQAVWWEDDTDLKVAADTALVGTRAFYSIPFGVIERPAWRCSPREKGMYEVPALNWADITDGRHGVTILNTGRHGHDALGGRLRLTLLASPSGGEKVHVPDPLADRGEHNIRYAFFPHAGPTAQARMARVAMDYEYAPLVFTGSPRRPDLFEDGLRIEDDRIGFSALKPSEDGQGAILRVFEAVGEAAPLSLSGCMARPTRAVNFLEDDLGEAPANLKPHEVISLRLV
jgi:alpha-mannosidase